MSAVSRRGLFGLFAGAALAPMIPRQPLAASRTIAHELQYAEAGTFTRYSGYEIMANSADMAAAAGYNWKHSALRFAIHPAPD